MNLKPSICFVAHFAYRAMSGSNSGHIGGVERQTSLMARWFAGRGYHVSMLTWDEGQPDGIEINGVRVFKICRRGEGLWGLRFFHPKWTGLVRAMRRADANIYYQNCGEYVTGQVALWCRRHDRKFVYSVACDRDCDPRLPEMKTIRERVLYRYGLRQADRVIVQTNVQQKMLQDGFGLDSEVIPMPCPGPSCHERLSPQPAGKNSHRVLWIGRICGQKRPDRLLDLAEECPDLMFDCVGPLYEGNYSRDIYGRAKRMHNVTIHGPVAYDELSDFYRSASCLCCTSDFEGFPNTFLEAWSYGLPIVSTFDPDGLIVKWGLGIVVKNIARFEAGIRTLLESSEKWRQVSENARQYYLENHAVESVMPRFEEIFMSTVVEGIR